MGDDALLPPSPFSPSALQHHVDAVLADLPAGHTHALVAYAHPDGTLGLSVAIKHGDGWRWGASLQYDLQTHQVSGELTVRGSW